MNEIANLSSESARDEERPEKFRLRIQGGMLEALGINMYSTIGKCLVEFVANAYDGEAGEVSITIPFDEIARARAAVKAQAKQDVKDKKRDPYTALLTPLSDDIAIVIEDDGHGMSPNDVRRKFLPINRKRRLDTRTGEETNLTSENGKRNVMGRKGLGKLAGFGAATKVVIRTKREGETFATTFTLDDKHIRQAEDVGNVDIPASYEDGLPTEEHGTKITLTGLKSDAVRYSADTIANSIREAFFGIEPAELAITINDTSVDPKKPAFAYCYPDGASVDNLAEATIDVDGMTELPIRYMVGFHPQGKHLPTAKRGARIYCNDRLAAGPSLFGLPTGMHNFHSQSYMECIVRADDLDRHGIDLVNTNRTQLREDNEIVKALIDFIEEAMRKALAAHAKWKEEKVEDDIQKSETARQVVKFTDFLEGKARTTARQLVRKIAVEYGVNSPQFADMAPLVVSSVNAGEVLVRLSELGHDPKSLRTIAINLVELAGIEKSDALKTYRGKRNGITALLKLINDGESKEMWKRKGIEKQLHNLFKEQPWLIRPEYSHYLTSDENLGKVSSAIAAHLGIDDHVEAMDDQKRPDLVFAMTDTGAPNQINIVELKSPSLPLTNAHLTQLEGYMAKVSRYCTMELSREVQVHGYLIGAMPDDKATAEDELLLLDRMRRSGPDTPWKVIGLRLLLEQAQAAHASVIEALQKDIENELADEPDPADDDALDSIADGAAVVPNDQVVTEASEIEADNA